MDLFRRILSGILVLAGIVLVGGLIGAMITKGNNALQNVRDQSISATMVNFRMTRVPHGPTVSKFRPGEEMFFNLETVRPEACFIDTDFRFARTDAIDAHTVWAVDGARVYAPVITHVDHISQSIVAPATLIPGEYMLTRITGWQCGNDTAPIMNTVMVPITIVGKNQPID